MIVIYEAECIFICGVEFGKFLVKSDTLSIVNQSLEVVNSKKLFAAFFKLVCFDCGFRKNSLYNLEIKYY